MIVEYQALNSSGTMVSDTISVDDQQGAYAELKRRGLTPIRINTGKATNKSASNPIQAWLANLSGPKQALPKRASKKELPFFTTQMSIMLETGTPVAASLNAMELQMTCPHWRALITQLRQHVEEGTPLSTAMSQYPNAFDPIYSSMISAGEMSGKLEEIFRRLAQISSQSNRLRSKVIAAMIYPTLLTAISISVLSVLTFFVLPRFETVFEEMNVDVPTTTKALLGLSHLVKDHLIISLGLIVGTISGIVYWFRSTMGLRFIARYSLRVPIIGPLISSINLSRIFRLLGLLVESSLPLLEALELTGSATKNFLYSELMEKVRANVIDGQPMYQALQNTPLVPPGVSQMIRTGEENGRISQVMNLLSDHLDEENETKVSTLTSIMEPLILIFMGMVVGTVAMSLVIPMFDLSQISGNS